MVQTGTGGCLTFAIMYVTFLFGLHKLKHLYIRHNPQISTFVEYDGLEDDEDYDTSDSSFMMAFALIDWLDGSLNDPNYIKWVARNITQNDGDFSFTFIPLDKCTDEDLSDFYPADPRAVKQMMDLHKAGGLFCLDWREIGPPLRGSWKTHSSYTAVDVAPIPCATAYEAYNGTMMEPHAECNWN